MFINHFGGLYTLCKWQQSTAYHTMVCHLPDDKCHWCKRTLTFNSVRAQYLQSKNSKNHFDFESTAWASKMMPVFLGRGHGHHFGHTCGLSCVAMGICDISLEDKLIMSLMTFGSRPSDHYFRSVCWFVCLSVCLCRVFLSRLWSNFEFRSN